MDLLKPLMLNDHWRDLASWTTSCVRPARQFNVWRDFVIDAHLYWDIRPVRCDQFPAFIRQGRFDGFRVIQITAPRGGGVSGRRTRPQIAQDREALYNLIYVADGSLRLGFPTHELYLGPGTFTLYDSTQPMSFHIGEGLREVTFSVPRKRLDDALPHSEAFCGHAMKATSGIGKLFIDCMLALETSFGELSDAEAGQVLEATTEMLVATLAAKVQLPEHRGSCQQLQHVMAGINRQLDDPHLTPRRVARDGGMSERHLYRLFAEANTTPASWIRKRRLEQCRRDLVARACAHLDIIDIAARWGFFDSSSFCRMFRQAYGMSPRQMRSSAAPART